MRETVHLLIAEWSDAPPADPRPVVAKVLPGLPGRPWQVLVAVRTDRGRVMLSTELGVDLPHLGGGTARTRLERLGPGAWALLPSLVGGGLHAFVVLRGAPEPAPWETPAAASGPHCPTCTCGRRAPVQGDGYGRQATRGPGSISWAEHLLAWGTYSGGHGQSAEEIAARGGFGYGELVRFLGREPETWEPRR